MPMGQYPYRLCTENTNFKLKSKEVKLIRDKFKRQEFIMFNVYHYHFNRILII